MKALETSRHSQSTAFLDVEDPAEMEDGWLQTTARIGYGALWNLLKRRERYDFADFLCNG